MLCTLLNSCDVLVNESVLRPQFQNLSLIRGTHINHSDRCFSAGVEFGPKTLPGHEVCGQYLGHTKYQDHAYHFSNMRLWSRLQQATFGISSHLVDVIITLCTTV